MAGPQSWRDFERFIRRPVVVGDIVPSTPGRVVYETDTGILYLDTGVSFVPIALGAPGTSTFLSLTDTPALYTGEAGKASVVAPGETSLIFTYVGDGTAAGDSYDDGAASPALGATDVQAAIDAIKGEIFIDDTAASPNLGLGTEASLQDVVDGLKALLAGAPIDKVIPFTFSTVSPLTLCPGLAAGDIIEEVEIVVTTAFDDPAATISVGTPASPSALFAPGDIDLSVVQEWGTDENLEIAVPDSLIMTISPAAASVGSGYAYVRLRPA
jgi:hypothetical protein